ncbi:MAG: 2-hydroxyacid dehydrogenase [Caldilineaceae bacterium]|nr:2-hydroxyacid dehydrogenase [Caldilineaceae bacterium]
MPNVLFFTNLDAEIVPRMIQFAPIDFHVTVHSPRMAEAEKCALAADADFFILFPSVIEEAVVRAASKLKLIQLVSAGFDKMPMTLLKELGIPVANNGGTNAIDVAEHTLSLILGLYRLLPQMDRNVRHNGWNAIDSGRRTYTIHGKTVGIVGMGNIGRRVAQMLRPFGARLLYYDAYPIPADAENAIGVERVDLPDLLRRSDVVTLHVPLNAETHGLIGGQELALMQPTSILVNTCRGPVVDETALTVALQSGQIRGAALDVLETEPPTPDNPLFTLENVLLTPHTAGVTFDTWARRGEFIFENLQRVWQGEHAHALITP